MLSSSARKHSTVGLPTGQGLRRGTRIWFHRRHNHANWGSDNFGSSFKRHCLDCQSGRPRWRRPPGEVTVDDLQANQDYSPRDGTRENQEQAQRIQWQDTKKEPLTTRENHRTVRDQALFSSKIVTARTPGQESMLSPKSRVLMNCIYT